MNPKINLTDWAYFDYAAATPVDPVVLDYYISALRDDFANSSTTHGLGVAVRKKIEIARTQFAELISAQPAEIIFTSGATESNNLAIKGLCSYCGINASRIITLQTEHKAVLDTVGFLARQGATVTVLPVDSNGIVDLAVLDKALQAHPTTLVSVMAVNNETGVIQPIDAIGDRVHAHGAKFHIDAAQALGKIPIDVNSWKADMISFSGHKVYAPKGVGALYVRRFPKVRLQAQIHGGGQERGQRAGTLPAALIQAFIYAALHSHHMMEERHHHVLQLAQALIDALPDTMHHNIASHIPHVPHILNIDTQQPIQSVLAQAETNKIALSAGSACQSAELEGSHVLRAMGKIRQASQSLRISLSHLTTQEERVKLTKFLTQIDTMEGKL